MRGFYLMYRGWLNNPVLNVGGEPYSRHAAWCWMIEEAAYQQGRNVQVLGGVIKLERGEFTHAIRFMGKRWGWSRGKVERFLRDLGEPPNGPMIETRTSHGQTVVRLCNYAKFQVSLNEGEPETGHETSQQTGQRRKKDSKEGSKEAKDAPVFAFAGEVFRITTEDMAKLGEQHPALTDLLAAVRKADNYYRERPPDPARRWFVLNNWLKRESKPPPGFKKTAAAASEDDYLARLREKQLYGNG